MSWGSILGGGGFGGLVGAAANTGSSPGGWAGALTGGGGSGWGSFFGNVVTGLFGGGGGGSGSGSGGNIWGQLLGGLQGYAQAEGQSILTTQNIQEKARQDRMSTMFEAQIVDHYKQRDKHRKRVALDTYGQFSTVNQWAPNATPAPAVEVPALPQGGV